tara:strand:+ start:194 stop:604 length:411 start_codon:yes stop_codon:yes gene_type:complete
MAATNLNLDISSELNITIKRGDTLDFDITVKDTDGDAVDLTAYNFSMDIRSNLSPRSKTQRGDVVLSDSTGGKNSLLLSLVGAADGTLTVSASKEAIASITPGVYFYDISATKTSNSSTQTWFFGTFTVTADVTLR